MVLSDKTIAALSVNDNYLPLIEPLDKNNLSPASVDLTLSGHLIDEFDNKLDFEKFKLNPGQFVLLSTKEIVNLPFNVAAFVKGKSSLARKGVMIECAGFVDPGFSGTITLQVKNLNQNHAILLKAGAKICQVVFFKLDQASYNPYSSDNGHHYQNQRGATKARS